MLKNYGSRIPSTRARIVLDRVAFQLEVTYRFRLESFEEHASAVVVDRVSSEGAAMGVCDQDAPRAARDVVANDLRVRPLRDSQEDPHLLVTARRVGEHLRPGRLEGADASVRVAYGFISCDGGVDAIRVGLDPDKVVFDDVVHNLGVAAIANADAFAFDLAAGGSCNVVPRDSGVDAEEIVDPAGDIAYGTISYNSSVASAVNVDHVRRLAPLPSNVEA